MSQIQALHSKMTASPSNRNYTESPQQILKRQVNVDRGQLVAILNFMDVDSESMAWARSNVRPRRSVQFWHDGISESPPDRVMTIMAIADDDQVFYRHYDKNLGIFKYDVSHIGQFAEWHSEMMIRMSSDGKSKSYKLHVSSVNIRIEGAGSDIHRIMLHEVGGKPLYVSWNKSAEKRMKSSVDFENSRQAQGLPSSDFDVSDLPDEFIK